MVLYIQAKQAVNQGSRSIFHSMGHSFEDFIITQPKMLMSWPIPVIACLEHYIIELVITIEIFGE